MLLCMRTTLNIDDELMRAVKGRAAERGLTITEIIEEALRESLYREKQRRKPYRLHWVRVKGRLQPGVDLTDRDSLYDLLEGRR